MADGGRLREARDVVGDLGVGVGGIAGRFLFGAVVTLGFFLAVGLVVFVLGLAAVLLAVAAPVVVGVGVYSLRKRIASLRDGEPEEPSGEPPA